MNDQILEKKSKIIAAGNRLDRLKLAPATSGNYSMRNGADEMLITISGAHKGMLNNDNIMRADLDGKALEGKTPSAETMLHAVLYNLYPAAGAILHTHSVANTVLTRLTDKDHLELSGYEMLKAYPNTDTHDTLIHLPVFNNTQDMVELSNQIRKRLQSEKSRKNTPALMLRGHGIYGWGMDMDEALRVIEATEMILECELYERVIRAREGAHNEQADRLSGHAA